MRKRSPSSIKPLKELLAVAIRKVNPTLRHINLVGLLDIFKYLYDTKFTVILDFRKEVNRA